MAEKGRPRAFDRDAALDAAMRLFWRKGFTATSMADLTSAMGIGAPSLYAAFGNKEALYRAALERFGAFQGRLIWGAFDAAPSARAAVESVLAASAAALPGGEGPPGCMVTLSAAADEDCSDELRGLVRGARAFGLVRLRARLDRAVAEGEIAAGADVDRIARFYICVQQGMSIQARDGAGPVELEGVARAAMAAWQTLTHP